MGESMIIESGEAFQEAAAELRRLRNWSPEELEHKLEVTERYLGLDRGNALVFMLRVASIEARAPWPPHSSQVRAGIERFVVRVSERAEAEILKTHNIAGAHHRALEAELALLRGKP